LLLRHDNADRRLTPIGHRIGLATAERWQQLEALEADIARAMIVLQGTYREGATLEAWLRRPEIDWEQLALMCPAVAALGISTAAQRQVCIEIKYAGYVQRQTTDVARQQKSYAARIPPTFDFLGVPQLRKEAKERLAKVRPLNLGQASRISGITPADLTLLSFYLNSRE
jgi:tRNA uridine 5-carboxymethylaminomethyl modification enzyme